MYNITIHIVLVIKVFEFNKGGMGGNITFVMIPLI
jgi:hypothetical protein